MQKTYDEIRKERFEKVRKLRDGGMRWKDVAKEMGVSIARVNIMYLYRDNDVPDSVRDEVRDLYEHTCAFCGSKNSLNVHHIYGRKHKKSNLMLVCRKCHVFLHKLKRKKDNSYKTFISKGVRH
jgi:predicted transcriptional regulator